MCVYKHVCLQACVYLFIYMCCIHVYISQQLFKAFCPRKKYWSIHVESVTVLIIRLCVFLKAQFVFIFTAAWILVFTCGFSPQSNKMDVGKKKKKCCFAYNICIAFVDIDQIFRFHLKNIIFLFFQKRK